MAIVDLFSKRQKRARGEMPDVYAYDDLPQPLRVQIVYIMRDLFPHHGYGLYTSVKDMLCREYGLFELVESRYPVGYEESVLSDQESVLNFFLQEKSVERALDVVELCFKEFRRYRNARQSDEAVAKLNERFKEHGVGYQFESGEIMRVDSQFLHAEAVKPTLAVLRDENFQGANEEFLRAHEHYQHGRYKECLVEGLKAFESVMKSICSARGWPTQSTDAAKALIKTCMDNGLFPAHFESQFSAIRALLESGVPTLRNKYGGHGQGVVPVIVPEYLARYALNLTATTILFMVEAHQATQSLP